MIPSTSVMLLGRYMTLSKVANPKPGQAPPIQGDPMHKVMLAVRVIQRGEVIRGYYRNLELPFVPAEGMRFEQGTSTTMWETVSGQQIDPQVERVVYDLDEDLIVCLFTVDQPLAASFWENAAEVGPGQVCGVLHYFRHMPISV
ncbi:hypothetical protein [Pseudomonas monteilii]|uniref:hypothetical protein n=2 Tax=Pseudomonas putida group TaxID=136845 RepID=UPI00383AA5B4